jgi:glutamate racemase
MKIGVFDSGIGGEAVAQQLQLLLPDAEVIAVNDRAHVPYGSRSADEIIRLTDAAIQPLFATNCDAIVIACNTATTVAIATLRERYPDTPFVGIEPMVKPAGAMTKTGHIAVFATPATLASDRYQSLKDTWDSGVIVDEPDCSTWAPLIEAGKSDEVPIESYIENVVNNGADVIVLGCTHYHWLKARAVEAAGDKAVILEPSDAISRRISSLLEQL